MWWRRRSAQAAVPAPVAGALAPGEAEAWLRRIDWTVRHRLDGLLQGDHRSARRGSGLDLADLREYQAHDDVRHIDWNVTARLNQPHVRVFTEDREMVSWLLIDHSPSQGFGSGRQSKQALMREVLLMLARLLGRHGDRVGAVLYGGEGVPPQVLPARGGREQPLRLLQALEQLLPAPSGQPTRLSTLLRHAAVAMRGRCTVVLVSDFLSEPGWEPLLGDLARRHDVLALRLIDPLEQQWPDLGLLTLTDAETGESLQVDTHDPGFRARFARLANERSLALHQALARAGADTLELLTDGDTPGALLQFLLMRRARARGRAAGPGPRALPQEVPT